MGRNKKLQEIDLSLNSLVVFRKLLTHDVILPLRALLDTEAMDPMIQLRKYTEFISRLYARSTNLTEYIFRLICEDENFYVKAVATGAEIDDMLHACVQNELAILQRLARIRPHELQKEVSYYGVLPEWNTSDIDFGAEYHERLRQLGKYGYGQFAPHPMFVLREEQLVPVQHPDPVRLSELTCYVAERQAVIDNIRALLDGRHAQNILLYGDAGTGKSATVKAVVNEFFSEGLRLIQITKDQLTQLPDVIDRIFDNPLKFILYIDDISFDGEDSSFRTLKATLEGSVSAHAENVIICATSNSRNLVGARDEDDDTELSTLSARFGLRVQFNRQERTEYLAFVQALAEKCGLQTEPDTLQRQAELFARQSGGYSPRAARQLVEQLEAKFIEK